MATPAAAMAQPPAAPGGWTPERSGLSQMVLLFADPNPAMGQEQHKAMYEQLNKLSLHPQYTAYLAYILLFLGRHAEDVRAWIPYGGPDQVEEIRARAGLELKNRIRDHVTWKAMEGAMRAYIKSAVLASLDASSSLLRHIVGTMVATLAQVDGLANWPGLLEQLVRMLDSQHPESMDGAFNALAKICEDMPKELDTDALGRPLTLLIPKFISFFQHPHKDIRRYAIATTNVFLVHQPLALLTNMDKYMEALFWLATHDSTPEVRKRVCQAFVLLLKNQFAKLQPHIAQVLQFMIAACMDADESVSLEACEFWPAYCKHKQMDAGLLRGALEHLVPVLLQRMCYSEDELAMLGDDDEDDQFVPDKAEDLKPRFHRSQATQGASASAHYPSSEQLSHMNAHDEDEYDEEEDPDDDPDEWDDETTDWTLRKCAAAALDSLANVYKADLLPFLLPKLQVALNSKSEIESEEKKCWVVREAAVLALGAIAEGCYDGLREYLPMLLPFLMAHFLTDKKPLVRSITCWTLSRYCKWIIHTTLVDLQNNHAQYFAPLLKGLLDRILDKNKKVQEAACTAFATLEEEARMMLVPYLKDILSTLMFAFQKYQARNMLILYDCLGTLSEVVHMELNKPELIAILMPPLMVKWNVLHDEDRAIFPLLECLTAIAQALRKAFLTFAEPVFGRCMKIIENSLTQTAEYKRLLDEGHLDPDMPDNEFRVCALDLLSGLAEGLEESLEPLVAKYSSRILGLLYACMRDLDPDVRQSAFALLGDLAKTCMGHLRPHLDKFVPQAACNLNPLFFSVCNNASWAIGEMAVKAGGESFAPYVRDVLLYLTPILQKSDPDMMRALLENVSITIGRLAYVCPNQVGPLLTDISKQWLIYLAPLKENQEKEHAFMGLALAIQSNPHSILQANAFPELAAAIASWTQPSQEITQVFGKLLHAYKGLLGPLWEPTLNACDQDVRAICVQMYGL